MTKPRPIRIESGIPIPSRPVRGCYGKWSKAVLALEPGDSFPIQSRKEQSMVLNAAKSIGIVVTTQKLETGGWRCWKL